MMVRVFDASRTLGKLKVFFQASMSRALNAAMKSSRHCIAAATAAGSCGMAGLLLIRSRLHAPARRRREDSPGGRAVDGPSRGALELRAMLRSAWAAAAAALLTFLTGPAAADEGMWPFDEAPVARVREALGVNLDARWLDHLRGASVRLTSGCSASIVSPQGLVLTNQHCIVSCAHQLSAGGRDLVADGFLAA